MYVYNVRKKSGYKQVYKASVLKYTSGNPGTSQYPLNYFHNNNTGFNFWFSFIYKYTLEFSRGSIMWCYNRLNAEQIGESMFLAKF